MEYQTLLRLPDFDAPRMAVEKMCETEGPEVTRERIECATKDIANEAIIRWLVDVPDEATYWERIRALLIVVDEWRARS